MFRASVCQTVDSGLYHTTEQQEGAGGQSTAAPCLDQLLQHSQTLCRSENPVLCFGSHFFDILSSVTFLRLFSNDASLSYKNRLQWIIKGFFPSASVVFRCIVTHVFQPERLPCDMLAASLMFHNDYLT